ncbi:hypothetical protein [Bianquea renquensis]|uniref:Uncharacterized protein n=1 Tax=Bianquea renquensis TaxID=2763661 RepID=A0A926DPG1_9FIRM|nr:hypothetical protein [Bianquea renquensis]MBC8542768.1 hypothetical protein [Bianquea renquensis]
MEYVSPNETISSTDDKSISLAIKKAKETGLDKVVIPRHNQRTGSEKWIIEDTILLPDDIEILLDNAHLVLADGTYINMFANENLGTDLGRSAEGEQHNITIRGQGHAVLDGGNYNGLSESTSLKKGRPHISRNTTLFFCNVSNLRVENLKILHQRWWGITNVFVRNSTFRNIVFQADLSRIDENGVHFPDQLPREYGEVYVKNADGIDLRVGCNNIVIENISGFTEDDTIALTALGEFEMEQGYWVEGKDADIHDVKIRNVSSDPYVCSIIRLLNENGHQLYNVEIQGVTDLRQNEAYQSQNAVRIGDCAYGHRPSGMGEMRNITVRNVVSRAKYAVALCKTLQDSVIENVTVLEGGQYGFGVYGLDRAPARMKNCSICNIVCAGEKGTPLSIEGLEGEFEIN